MTTVTIGGETYRAGWSYWDDQGRELRAVWIETGLDYRYVITQLVTELIIEARNRRIALELPTRDVIDAAMRVERAIRAHCDVDQVTLDDVAIGTPRGDIAGLAEWAQRLLDLLPEMVRHAVAANLDRR